MMTKEQKTRLVHQIMAVLDGLSEEYLIHKQPLIKKSDSIDMGWGRGKKMTINFVFQTIKPTRGEIESWVKGHVDRLSEGP